jgi:predicted lipid carrier protein YhbT
MATWRNALDLIKAEFPAFLKANHIPYDKVVWSTRGFTTNTDNRHIHL